MSDWHLWTGRAVVIAFAALAGLTVVVFTWLAEHALARFFSFQADYRLGPILWMPVSVAAIVWVTNRWAPGAAGSGIPQVMAALSNQIDGGNRGLYVSIRLTVAKILLTTWGLLAGLSIGREGPSVQIAAGVMHNARRWMPKRARISDHSLLTAGGAAGIAAAFNTPLGGVMFAIEELLSARVQKYSGVRVEGILRERDRF